MDHVQRRARFPSFSVYLGYAVSAVTFGFGSLLLTGWLVNTRMPGQFRIMFGVVLVLMGVYRFVLTRTKIRQWQTGDDEDSEQRL